jgi:hypothetical protein
MHGVRGGFGLALGKRVQAKGLGMLKLRDESDQGILGVGSKAYRVSARLKGEQGAMLMLL